MNYKNKDFVDSLVKEHSSMLVRLLTRRIHVDQMIGTSRQFVLNQNAQTGLYSDRIMRNADG